MWASGTGSRARVQASGLGEQERSQLRARLCSAGHMASAGDPPGGHESSHMMDSPAIREN